ncbi:MAG: DUF5677 domain-containing protein [Planctomycetota bacterium]
MDDKITKLIEIYKKMLDFVDADVKQAIHDHVKTQRGFKDTCFVIFAKSTKTYRAIQQLCNNGLGYGEDAIILTRSLLENLINLAYIANPQKEEEREHRAELFANWLLIDLKRKIDKSRHNDPLKLQLEAHFKRYQSIGADYDKMNELHKEECRKVKPNSDPSKNWSWSGLSLGGMAKDVDSSIPQTKLYTTYHNESYWLYSQIVHLHPGGCNSYMKSSPTGNGIVIHDELGPEWIKESLCSSFEYYSKIVELINNIFNLNLTKLYDIAKDYVAIVEELYSDSDKSA